MHLLEITIAAYVNETASFQKSIHYIPEERNYNNLRLMRNTFYNGYF